jgi:hypothetical protein
MLPQNLADGSHCSSFTECALALLLLFDCMVLLRILTFFMTDIHSSLLLPFACIISFPSMLNLSLYLPAISVWTFSPFFCCLAYLQKVS